MHTDATPMTEDSPLVEISDSDDNSHQNSPLQYFKGTSSPPSKKANKRGYEALSPEENRMLMHQVKQLQNQLTKMHEDHNATIAQLNETFKQQLEFAKAESVRSRREAENTLIQLRAIIMASVIDDPVRAQQINEAFAAFEQTKGPQPSTSNYTPKPTPPINTANKFAILDTISTRTRNARNVTVPNQSEVVKAQKALKAQLEAQNNPNQPPPAPITNRTVKQPKIPQIVVLLEPNGCLKNGKKLAEVLQPLNVDYRQTRTSNGYRVFPKDLDSHFAISEALAGGAQHYTHDQKSAKTFKRVLKGLDQEDPDEVKMKIGETTSVTPSIVTTLGRGSALSGQLYLVTWPAGTMNATQLESHRYLGRYKVSWEAPRKREPGPTQCTRCTRFGHGQKNCNCNPVCLFCAGNHLFNTCVMATAEETVRAPHLKCFNCSQIADRNSKHAANDKVCLSRAEALLRRPAARSPKVNSNPTPNHFDSIKWTPGSTSFASIARKGGQDADASQPSSSNHDFLLKMRAFAQDLNKAKSDFERKALAIDFMLSS